LWKRINTVIVAVASTFGSIAADFLTKEKIAWMMKFIPIGNVAIPA